MAVEPSRQRVSVISVNYNGRGYLEALLDALARQTCCDKEIILVDNGSSDGSVEFIRRNHPEVRLIDAGGNRGFAGGNNLGMTHARGEYLVLINNDTVPEPRWLETLIDEADADPEVGAVCPKISFYLPFVPFDLECPTFVPGEVDGSTDRRVLGMMIDESLSLEGVGYDKRIYGDGLHGRESAGARRFRWTGARARVWLPVDDRAGRRRLQLTAASRGPNVGGTFRVFVLGEQIGEGELSGEFRTYRFDVDAARIRRAAVDIINNAGSFLDERGVAGDRGIFQPDEGQFDSAEDVAAFCGCSVLLRRAALERVGTFDERFFMYYEDTDLSWRLGRAGWRLRYTPRSRVRHVHAGSAGEESALFHFYTTRNRLLMVLKNGGPAALLRAAAGETAHVLRRLKDLLRATLVRAPRAGIVDDLKRRAKAHGSLLKLAPGVLLGRLRRGRRGAAG